MPYVWARLTVAMTVTTVSFHTHVFLILVVRAQQGGYTYMHVQLSLIKAFKLPS
jgi:hypothetical protein